MQSVAAVERLGQACRLLGEARDLLAGFGAAEPLLGAARDAARVAGDLLEARLQQLADRPLP